MSRTLRRAFDIILVLAVLIVLINIANSLVASADAQSDNQGQQNTNHIQAIHPVSTL